MIIKITFTIEMIIKITFRIYMIIQITCNAMQYTMSHAVLLKHGSIHLLRTFQPVYIF